MTPKCVLCLAAFFGAGTLLGLGGPELCGDAADSPATWAGPLAWLGVISGFGTYALLARTRRAEATPRRSTSSG